MGTSMPSTEINARRTMSFLSTNRPSRASRAVAETFALQVQGYDLTAADPARHAMLGVRKDTGEVVRIELRDVAPKPGSKYVRPTIETYSKPRKFQNDPGVTPGGEVIVEAALPVAGSPNTLAARWINVVTHDATEKSRTESLLAAVYSTRAGKTYVEALIPKAHPAGPVQSADAIETFARAFLTRFAANPEMAALGLPFVMVRGFDKSDPQKGALLRIRAGAAEPGAPNDTAASIERALASPAMAEVRRRMSQLAATDVIEVQGAVAMSVGGQTNLPMHLFSDLVEARNPDDAPHKRSKGFTECVVGLHYLPPRGQDSERFVVKSILPTTSEASFDLLARTKSESALAQAQSQSTQPHSTPDVDLPPPSMPRRAPVDTFQAPGFS